ncbi:hypothetical protein M3212_15905 [Alkalihalobacillus oceani]|uniref:hypothetical protein n=1 Tax=Halalkalibacter oceani TaxID=1653776 RepID=UPI00203F5176|nr:hypothetical protein [Halalkalibacter oceani]MCM3762258.1 hypothetical protein [Halalkalibacter oceani]
MLLLWLVAIGTAFYTVGIARKIFKDEGNTFGAIMVGVLAVSILLGPVFIQYFR